MPLVLTIKPVKKVNKEGIKQEDVSDKCPNAYPVPVSINKNPAKVQDLNSESVIMSRENLRNI